MKRIVKALIFVVLLGITIITSLVGISKLKASELTVDEILINAKFPQETINKLSNYTKAELAKQVIENNGFEYKIMTLNEVESIATRGQIPDDDLTIIITTMINKVENGAVKEIKVKIYYEWTNLPVWRLEDPIVVQWDATKFSYQEGSFYSEDRYERNGDYLHTSRTGYYDRNQDSFCWYADLKAGYFLGIGGTISKLYGFGELILNVKDEHQLYGTSFIKTTYVHSKISVEMGISFYGEIGVEIPKTSNDQVTTDILFNWSTPLVLTPADYAFEQQYFFYEKSSSITKNTYTLQTTRLRCGYIEEEYIVLSPRRENAGVAYLAFSFNDNISQINVDMTMWSNSEYLYASDGSVALLQVKDNNNNWITLLDLLNDITLPTDRNNPNNYIITFPQNIKEFRFYVASAQVGNRNKGRVCIGNIEIFINY
ncbi:MAG: hypothetical protein ACLUG4_08410 [Bacilli bacterium]|jgi:hypothetical protein|nr:hypothetical protein [Staphylococcus sp.]